jgi:hypothetical protein
MNVVPINNEERSEHLIRENGWRRLAVSPTFRRQHFLVCLNLARRIPRPARFRLNPVTCLNLRLVSLAKHNHVTVFLLCKTAESRSLLTASLQTFSTGVIGP